MKKVFQLKHPKIKVARLLDNARHDVKKYLKRERNKELHAAVDFWDFDCKFGATAEQAKSIHVSEISNCINTVEAQQLDCFYLEIIAKPATRTAKTDSAQDNDSDD